MAAEPQRTNQSLVNGQNEDGSSSRGIADRDTVGGEQIQEQQPERVRVPPHINWPRQQRPQEFGRGFTPPPNRLPLQGAIRRASPWSVLKAKLPDQQPFRFSHEHLIQRMQNPEDRPRVQEPNGAMRPPSGMVRPPPGQMPRPQSQEGLMPNPGGPPPPRSPFLQRADSRTGFPNAPGMPRPMSAGRPPSASQMGRSLDDDDDVMTGSSQSRPGSARPMSMPGPMGVRPGSGPPMRPTNRTPPQSPAGSGIYSMRSPQSGRQSSLSSLSEQGEQKTEGLPITRPPSVNQNLPRTQPSAPRPEPPAAQPPPPESFPQPVKPNPDVERKLSVTINEPENLPKRPTDLAGPPRGEKEAANTNGEVKEVANEQTKKEPVVNGNQESPKKSPSKVATPKKLGNVQTPVKSPSKLSPKTPDTPGTAEKKNISESSQEHITHDTSDEQNNEFENAENIDSKQNYTEEILEIQETEYSEKQWSEEYIEQEYDTQYEYTIQETQEITDTDYDEKEYTHYTTNELFQETQQDVHPAKQYSEPQIEETPPLPEIELQETKSHELNTTTDNLQSKNELNAIENFIENEIFEERKPIETIINKQTLNINENPKTFSQHKKGENSLTNKSTINQESNKPQAYKTQKPTDISKSQNQKSNKLKVTAISKDTPSNVIIGHSRVKQQKFKIAEENTEKTSDPNNDTQNRVHFAQEQPKPKDTIKQEESKKTEPEVQREQSKPTPMPTPTNEKVPTPKPESPKLATPVLKPASPILKPASPILKPATPISKPATPKPTIVKQDSLQNQLPESPLIKLPMNKVQVGAAPSPNLKCVKSKIGSLENAKHKPGGGNVKIENRKLNFNATPKITAKNDQYTPGGGEKKIQNVKLQWNAKSKIGSLENASHKPGGGDKKIESVKLDFKEKAKPKVGSKDNIKHTPGGGTVKSSEGSQDGTPTNIEDQKLEIKATSKVGSLDNVKHKPGGGEVKIFDDKEYLKQMAGPSSDVHAAAHQEKKSRSSSSSSRQKLSDSRSGTCENLSENKQESPEKNSKPIVKPIDQNSNQLQEKTQENKTEAKKDTPPKPNQTQDQQRNLEGQKDANANGKVTDVMQKEKSSGVPSVVPNEYKDIKPAEKVMNNQGNNPNQQIISEKLSENAQQPQMNTKNLPPLPTQPQIKSTVNNGIAGPNSPLPSQSNRVMNSSVSNLPMDKNNYPVVEKSLIEKTEKELKNPVELHKNNEGIK